jgi:hypothetical protein
MAHLNLKYVYNRGKLNVLFVIIIFIVLIGTCIPPISHSNLSQDAPFYDIRNNEIEYIQNPHPLDIQGNKVLPRSTRAPIDEFDLKYILGYGSMIGFLNSIKSADVDSDGTDEVVFGNKEGNIYVLDMSGIDPVTEWISPILGGSTFGIGLGDVDDDSKIEIVCGSGDGFVRVFGYNNGSYEMEWESPNLGQFAYGLEVGNTDSDEYLEIVVGTGEILFDYDTDGGWAAGTSFDPNDENLYVFGYDGANIVQDWSTIVPALYDGTGIYNIAIGDTDDDSINEIVIGTFEWEMLSGDFEGRYGIYGFDGSSYESEWAIRELGNWIMGIGVGDTDGDSDYEIVIAVWDTAFWVYGYFIDPVTLDATYIPEYLSFTLSPFTLTVGDIDNDGIAEIIEAEGTEANVFDYIDGSYTLVVTLINENEQLTGLGVGDTDSNSPEEILMGHDSSILTWSKQGSEYLPWSIGNGLPSTVSVAAQDVDRNDQNEIYVLSRSGIISVLELDGVSFKLKDRITIPSNYSFTNILIDDFDNDGFLELCAVEGNTSIKYSGGWLIRSWGSSSTLYFIEYNGNDYEVSDQVIIPDNALFTAESADYDNDDKTEVVIGGTNGDLVFVEHNGVSYEIDNYVHFSEDEIICLDSGDTDSDGTIEIGMSNDTGAFKVVGFDGSDYVVEWGHATNFPIAMEIGDVNSDPGEEIFIKGGFNFDMNIFKWDGATYVEDAVLTGYDMVFDEALVVGELLNKGVLVVNSLSSSLIEYDLGYSQIWESGVLGTNAQSSGIENVDSDASNDLIVAFKGNIFIYGTFGGLNPVLWVSDNSVGTGEQVIFDGSQSTGTGQLDYFFDFGDGTNSGWISSSQTTHSYSSVGTYIATLRVGDQSGAQSPNVDSKTIIVSIIVTKPTAIIDSISPNPALEGETVSFVGHGTDDKGIVDWEWISNINGFLGDDAETDVSFLFVGEHIITFMVKNEDGIWSDGVTSTLRVNGKPEAQIDSISPNSPNEGDVVTFKGHGTDDTEIVGYNWRSNVDGFLSNAQSFSKSTLSVGAHIISLKVMDSDGAWSDEAKRNLYINSYPVATIESISPDEALVGDLIFFTGLGDDDGSITSYSWESDIDGFLSSKETFSTSTLSLGVHTISFTIRDNKGVWSQPDEKTVTIREIPENIAPEAFIDSVEPAGIKEGELVNFVGHGDDVDGIIDEYFWESDLDGLLSVERSFSTRDLSVGTHVITFRVRDDERAWSEAVDVVVVVEEEKDSGISFFGFDFDELSGNSELTTFCVIFVILVFIIMVALLAAFWSKRKRRAY